MKITTIVTTIILAMVISLSSAAFAAKKMDLSEKTGVLGWIIENNAKNYLEKYHIPFKMKNIRIDSKSSKRNKYGADVKSYLIIADIELKGYEEYGYEMAFYVYTGEMKDAQIYYVDGFIASLDNVKEVGGLKKYIKNHRKMVKNNTAFTKVSLDLVMLASQ